jgi:hypothetical protein
VIKHGKARRSAKWLAEKGLPGSFIEKLAVKGEKKILLRPAI